MAIDIVRTNLDIGLGRRRCINILQSQAAECGLACLAMIAGYYGQRTSLSALRSRFSVSMKGLALKDLVTIADKMNMNSRPVRVELEELSQLRTPCILHWKFNHFVVLVRATKHSVDINDPARGRCFLSREEFSVAFTGVALELTPTPDFKSSNEVQRVSLRELVGQVGGIRRAFLTIFLLSVCLEAVVLLMPAAFQIILDQATVTSDWSLLTLVCLGIALLVIIQVMAAFARSWAIMTMNVSLSLQWSAGLFRHLLRLPISFFQARHTGDIVSRFSSLNTIQSTLSIDFIRSLLDGLMAAGTCLMMYLYGGLLLSIVLATSAVYLAIRVLFFGPYRRATEETIAFRAQESTYFLETVRGIASVKTLGMGPTRRTAWSSLRVDALNSGLRTQKIDILFTAINTLLFGFDRALLIWLGIGSVLLEQASIGAVVAFLAYREIFRARLVSLTDATLRFRMLDVHRTRTADIAYALPEPNLGDKGRALVKLDIKGTLDLQTISFRYGDADDPVFSNLSLWVEAGESVALTGASGCGKTTLLRIMCGLLEPSQGKMLVDGHEIAAIGFETYRNMCGCVLQDDQLFAGTIAENITAFTEEVDEEKIREVACLAAIDQDIERFPMAYETLVGDMGSVLSGGQKQRIFLARALYKEPRILFLDEATSHLDQKNEELINEAVRALAVTRVMIAHRPSTIALADREISL